MKSSIPLLLLLGLFSMALFTACGGGDQKSELEKLSDAAEEMAEKAGDMAEQAQEMATSISDDHEPQPAVHFKVLINYLPDGFGDLERGEPRGEKASMGNWAYSSAEVTFTGMDNSSVHVEIHDYAYISMLYATFNMVFKMGFEEESSEGFKRTTEIAGYPAIEEWREESQRGEATILVGERFIVTVTSRNLPHDMPRQIIETMDLSGLAKETAETPPA